MSNRENGGSHYENHQLSAELHDGAAHAYRVGEQHGKQDHLTGHEHSRQALEHTHTGHRHFEAATTGSSAFGHEEIAALAHQLWRARGCPGGSPEVDWFHALEQLRSRA
jgi:hypothetical protein